MTVVAVQRCRDVRLDGACHIALHEQTLAIEDGRQLVVTGAQLGGFRSNPEQGRQEILERAGQLDQQIGLVLVGQGIGRGARGQQPGMGVDMALLQPADKGGIEADEALAVVEVREAETVAQRRRRHVRNIRVGRGVIRSYANRLDNAGPERKTSAEFATLMPDDATGRFTHGPADMQPVPASVRNWLIVVAAMIFFMIVIGALTRLTESGLSMVEWRPVTGWLPPLSDAAWQTELQKYLSSPQGRLINRGFTIAEFKEIFWLEYIHRLWGRLIGVVFALPLAWFWIRGKLSPALKPRLAALLVLGGLQGALGWAMVASGLVDRPSVSHYRLAGHLLLAVVLYAYTVWLILELGPQGDRHDNPRTRRDASALIGLLFVVLTWGALMAGLRAGAAHNTFPTMSGHWLPPGLFEQSPWWINLVRKSDDRAVRPSLAGQAPGAGRAGHGLARAACRSRPGGGDRPGAAKSRNCHDPDRCRHSRCNIAPGRSRHIADLCDRRAASRDVFSGPPGVGYCWRMSGTFSRPTP